MNRPPCLGFYESGNIECDGLSSAPIRYEQVPCTWRDRCAGLQAFCGQTNHQAAKVITTLGDQLVSLCDTQVQKLGIVEGLLPSQEPPKPKPKTPPTPESAKPSAITPSQKPSKKSPDEILLEKKLTEAKEASERARTHPRRRRKAATKSILSTPEGNGKLTDEAVSAIKTALEGKPVQANVVSAAPERPQNHPVPPPSPRPRKKVRRRQKAVLPAQVVELAMHFESCLRDAFPEHAFAGRGRVVAKPGTFYAVDRLKGSSYIRWYCASERGRDFAVARVRLKPRSLTVDIDLPVSIDQLSKGVDEKTFKRLNPKHRVDGQFYALCRKLDKGGAGLAVLALRLMVSEGIISFPKGQ